MQPRILAIALLACTLLLIPGCSTTPGSASSGKEVQRLIKWMEGDFDNTTSLADASRQAIEEHFPIEVHVRRLPAIPNALYVEQASMSAPDRPYRQRVYLVHQAERGALVEVWKLRNEKEFANAHLDPDRLAGIEMDILEHRAGCDVHLIWNGDHFRGGTRGKACESTLAGATYATSEVAIHAWGYESLDRGYDTDGTQVWGAQKQPYLFLRSR